jgi:hypothetical protein
MFSSDFKKGMGGRSRQAAVTAPTACPACQSGAITTTARHPDENTYWRCKGCGEIWNAARWAAGRTGGNHGRGRW